MDTLATNGDLTAVAAAAVDAAIPGRHNRRPLLHL